MPVTGLRSSPSPPTGRAVPAKGGFTPSRTGRMRSGPCSNTGPLRLAVACSAGLSRLRLVAGEEQRLGECQVLNLSRVDAFAGGVHEGLPAGRHGGDERLQPPAPCATEPLASGRQWWEAL